MGFKAKDVEEAINSQLFYNEDLDNDDNPDYEYFAESWDELEWTLKYSSKNKTQIPNLLIDGESVDWEIIESDTGGEGHGEHCHVVIRVGNQYFNKDGFYASHYGSDWDGAFTEVMPVKEYVTIFKALG